MIISYKRDGKTYLLSMPSDHAEWAEQMLGLDLAAHDAEVAAKAVSDAAEALDNADDFGPFRNPTEDAPLGWTNESIEAAIMSSGVITDWLRARAAEYRKAVQ